MKYKVKRNIKMVWAGPPRAEQTSISFSSGDILLFLLFHLQDLVYKGIIKVTYDRGYALQTKSLLVESTTTVAEAVVQLFRALGLRGAPVDYALEERNIMTGGGEGEGEGIEKEGGSKGGRGREREKKRGQEERIKRRDYNQRTCIVL